jgi:CheY-like chemotaxis protein
VLLVQLDDDNREMYAEFLRHKGLTPICVSNARDALGLAPHADVIVTGVMLAGDMSGFELIHALRDDNRTRNTPIIVLTAHTMLRERERAERAGCDVFLPKPCAPDVLVQQIDRLAAPPKLRLARAKSVAARPKGQESKRSA